VADRGNIHYVLHSPRRDDSMQLAVEGDKFIEYRPVFGSTLTAASACCAENSRVLALSLCLDRLIAGRFSEFLHFIKSQFYSLTSAQNVSITKLFESWIAYIRCVFNSKFLSDWQQICCVFNKCLRKYYCEAKKMSSLCKKSC
jgi:hypothetical protein